MSERRTQTYVKLIFIEPRPKEGVDIEFRLWTKINDEWMIEYTKTKHAYEHWDNLWINDLLTYGEHAVDFRIVSPKDLYGWVCEIEYTMIEGGFSAKGGAVTLNPFWTNRHLFTTVEGDKNNDTVTIEGQIWTGTSIIEEMKALGIDISTNNPETANLLSFLGSLGTGFLGGLSGLGGLLNSIRGLASGLVGGFFTGLLDNISNILHRSSKVYTDKIIAEFKDVMKGSPEWEQRLLGEGNAAIGWFIGQQEENMNPLKWIDYKRAPIDYIKSLNKMSTRLAEIVIGSKIIGTGLETISFGQIEGFSSVFDMANSMTGLPDVIKETYLYPIEMSMLTPFRHSINSQFPTLLPTYADLINMRVKEKLTEDEFKLSIAKQGFSNYWAGKIWDAHFNAPSYGDILKAKYRTGMSNERFLDLIKIVDLDPIYNEEVWLPNVGELPAISDLINQRVKEVITQTEFNANLEKWGYNPKWGSRIWDAHFIPPTLNDIMTAYRRQIPVTIPEVDEETGEPKPRDVEKLSPDDVRGLMKLVDLDPRYQSIFDTRFYEDPTIRDARYMFEIGAYNEEDIKDVLRRRGYNPTDQESLAKYLVSFRERGFYTKYLTAIQTAYQKGAVTDEELTEASKIPDFPKGVDYWIRETANIRRRVDELGTGGGKPKILTLGELKRGYLRDKIVEDDFRTRLNLLGYNIEDVQLLIDILQTDKITEDEGRRVVSLTISQLLQAFRYNHINEDELRTRIMQKGLDLEEVNLLIDTTKSKWAIGNVESA